MRVGAAGNAVIANKVRMLYDPMSALYFDERNLMYLKMVITTSN